MRVSDVCYRLGGDEFAVILQHLPKASKRTLKSRVKWVMEHLHLEGFEKCWGQFWDGVLSSGV